MNTDNDAQFAASLEAESVALYHPPPRPHAMDGDIDSPSGCRMIGVSNLVKSSATELAQRILSRQENEDPSNGFWARTGNELARIQLSPLTPYREVQLRRVLRPSTAERPGWALVGHADGVSLRNGMLLVDEHKAQASGDEDEAGSKIDLAQRQACVYLCMLQRQLDDAFDAGATSSAFPKAPFDDDPTALPLEVQFVDGAPPPVWGIRTHFWDIWSAQGTSQARRVLPSEAAEVMRFYAPKLAAIIEAVESADLSKSIAWDISVEGLQEFKRVPSAREHHIDESRLLRLALENAYAAAQVKRWDAVKDDRGATACALMREHGDLKTCEVSGPDGEVWAKPTSASTANSRGRYLKPNARVGKTADELKAALERLGAAEKPTEVTA